MIVRKYSALCLVLLLAIYNGCIDDKGNYDFDEISTAILDNSGEAVVVNITPTSKLFIDPPISFTEGKGYNDYSFEWLIYNASGNATEVISRGDTPELNIELPASMKESGSYNLLFRAINNQTQVQSVKRYKVIVANSLQMGYLALVEKSDGLELEMIALFNDTLTLYPNLLQLANSTYPRVGRKPISLALFQDITAPSPADPNSTRVKYSVYIVTDKGTDRLRPEDYSFIENDYNISKVSVISKDYFSNGKDLIPEKMQYYHATATHYIFLNNNWFFANRNMMLYYFMDPINTPFGEINYYKPSPYMVNYGNGAILYDMDRNRFMRQGWGTMDIYYSVNVLCTRALTDADGDKFKFNDPDYTLVYMNNIEKLTGSGTGFAIMQHKVSGKHEIWTFRGTNTAVTKTDRFVFPSSLDYSSMKHFVYHPYAKFFYCATEDKVYSLTMTQENPIVEDLSDMIPAGHKISMFKSMQPNKGAVTPKAFCYFALGTYDPTKEINTCGTLSMFDTDLYTGKFTLAQHPKEPPASGYRITMQWDGLGKIVDLDYKAQ